MSTSNYSLENTHLMEWWRTICGTIAKVTKYASSQFNMLDETMLFELRPKSK